MKVLIGTKNPAKIEGAKTAFDKYFASVEIDGVSVSSDVSEQPVNEEIYQGARNRVDHLRELARENRLEADYFIGIESGITNQLGKWMIINIAVIKDKNGKESWGGSPAFPVPDRYVDEIIKFGLGKVMDTIFAQKELGKGKGGISFLTAEEIRRTDLTKEAFIMALTQFINGDIWSE